MPLIALAAVALTIAQTSPSARILGDRFEGGAKSRYGANFEGRAVNFVYAQPTGNLSRMTARIALEAVPDEASLWLRARDDDGPGICGIEILLNGKSLFSGKNRFEAKRWSSQRLSIPARTLRPGVNVLEIRNIEPKGDPGMPPWFMVAEAAIGSKGFTMRRDISRDFTFELPTRKRPIPEPLAAGEKPGFAIRGIKGWMWKPEDYFQVVPVLAAHRMNFLMNCYTNMTDLEHYAWGDPKGNRWWEPIPESKKAWLARLADLCAKSGIQFCFSMNPNLGSGRPLRYDSPEDLEALWSHYAWMQSRGVRWFNVSLDDITSGIDAPGQVRVVNEIYRRLRAKDPKVQLIFCPTWYWGDGTEADKRLYLDTVANDLHRDIYVFWTGKDVVGPIRREDAASYKAVVKHRLFLWDNYPVNDGHSTMHLGPAIHRDSDLNAVIDGYMSNSMCQQTEANRIPMATCADYAYNPRDYDPERSIGQAILNLAKTPTQRRVLRDLVLAYPGMLMFDEGKSGTSHNPVRADFTRISAGKQARFAAEAYANRIERLVKDMERAFPGSYLPERTTVRTDLAWLRERLAERDE